MKVIQDDISQFLFAIAVILLLYFLFVGGLEMLITPAMLILGSLAFRVYLNKREGERGEVEVQQDVSLDEEETQNIFVWALLGIVGFYLTYQFVKAPAIPVNPFTLSSYELGYFDERIFSGLMAILEERFFRGEVFEFLSQKTPRVAAVIGQAVFFLIYHFRVYGGDMLSLVYVGIAGLLAGFIVMATRRLSPVSVSHTINNVM